METNKAVEWELVDYGSAVFHVVSYQAGLPVQPVQAAQPAVESIVPLDDLPTPNCFFYRCWVALKDGCHAA